MDPKDLIKFLAAVAEGTRVGECCPTVTDRVRAAELLLAWGWGEPPRTVRLITKGAGVPTLFAKTVVDLFN